MASVNKVILIGNLGDNPVSRHMPNGEMVVNISMATTESWKDKNTGEKKDLTEWHRVTFYRKLAEIAAQYLKKGSSIYIEGRLRTRKWNDKDDGRERYMTEIIADTMQMLGSRRDDTAPMSDVAQGLATTASAQVTMPPPSSKHQVASSVPAFAEIDDDIPF